MEIKKHYFRAKEILTPLETIRDGLLGVQGSSIIHLAKYRPNDLPKDAIFYSFPDKLIIPGLIDTHIHGYGGYGGYGLARGEGIGSQETRAT